MSDSLFSYAMLAFTSFFTLANPLGTMPVFLSMTQGIDNRERSRIVLKATTVACLMLIGFTLFGKYLFQFFGLSTNGFRIAGGIIIFKIGYDMLQAHFSHVKLNEKEQMKQYANDISITPLAIPMLCGPGAIANGIVMMEEAKTFAFEATLISVIVLVFILAYVILRFSTRLVAFIGETGNNVMMRLMGLILMVIGVECFVGGASPIMTEMINESLLP